MGNMKRILFTAMLMALVITATACGRTDKKNMTTAPRTTQATTQATTAVEPTMESTGILQDMVDGVEQGMDNLMDGTRATYDDNMNSATKGK